MAALSRGRAVDIPETRARRDDTEKKQAPQIFRQVSGMSETMFGLAFIKSGFGSEKHFFSSAFTLCRFLV